MARNYLGAATIMPWHNDTETLIKSGEVVVIGHSVGIAQTHIAPQDIGSVRLVGAFDDLPKLAGDTFTQGQVLAWSLSEREFTTSPAEGDLLNVAIAWRSAAAGQTKCEAMLTPNTGSIAPAAP